MGSNGSLIPNAEMIKLAEEGTLHLYIKENKDCNDPRLTFAFEYLGSQSKNIDEVLQMFSEWQNYSKPVIREGIIYGLSQILWDLCHEHKNPIYVKAYSILKEITEKELNKCILDIATEKLNDYE